VRPVEDRRTEKWAARSRCSIGVDLGYLPAEPALCVSARGTDLGLGVIDRGARSRLSYGTSRSSPGKETSVNLRTPCRSGLPPVPGS